MGNTNIKHSAVDKALMLLQLLGDCAIRGEARLTDLVKASGYRRPTVHRLLATLKSHGFVDQEQEGGVYRLGSKVMALGAQAYGTVDLREIARPLMLQLSKQTLMAIHLAIVDAAQVVYIDKVEAIAPIRLASGIGWRGGLHCTALGKVMTAFRGQEFKNRALQAGLSRRTAHTIVDPADFDVELERVLKRGYAVDDQENEPQVRCMAAPILNDAGRAVAGISISGTIAQITERQMRDFAASLLKACASISEQLGHRPDPS
jgi:DNA-binding IclR family transcriptional regulator